VGLQADEPVHDMDARFFEGAGPRDVGLLVETRLELHHRGDLLARFGRLDQRRRDGLSPEVRYSVCLMANTSGSAAAWAMNNSTDVVNES